MAVQGNLIQPYPDLVSIDNVVGIPVGALVDPWVMETVVDFTIDTVLAARFPTPPSALGFLTDVYDGEGEPIYGLDGLEPPYFLTGSLYPESDYLEPTTGQIWPRIG